MISPQRASVSVLLPTYNRARFLAESIRSILNQTTAPKEILVINDGSTDNTREVVREFEPDVQYVEKANGGKSSALNLGLEQVRGEFVWVMDDDDVALPQAIELHLAALLANPESGFSYSGYIEASTGSDGKLVTGDAVLPPEIRADDFFLHVMERNILRGSPAMMVRTACYREVGPYDGALIRSQDYDMLLRLSERYSPARVAAPTYCYRMHQGERGSGQVRVAANASFESWRDFNVVIFRRLRDRLKLQHYLPRSMQKLEFTPDLRRRALLQRMTIMATHNLQSEMLADLEEAVALAENTPLSDAEKHMLHRAMSYPLNSDSVFSASFMRQVRNACTGPVGRQIQYELSRGLYWRLRSCGSGTLMFRFSRALLALSPPTRLAAAATGMLSHATARN